MTSLTSIAKRWLPRVAAIGLLIFAIQRAGPANVWHSLLNADIPSVALAGVLVFPFLVARAARWRVVLRDLLIGVTLIEAIRLYAIGLWIGTITPGQAGDAIKAWYLSNRGESLAVGLLSCFLDRLFDILVLALLATTALAVFWPAESGQWVLGSGIVAGVGLVLLFLARPDVRARVTSLPLLHWFWRPVETWLKGRNWGLALLASRLHALTLVAAFVMTVLGFGVTLSRVYLVFHAVGVDLPVLTFVAVASVTVFASLVSVAGLGSRDVALIAMLTPFGYLEQQAVAASFLILFLNFTNAGPGLIVWLGRPIVVTRADADT